MVVRSLDIDKDPFRPRENNEEILGPEVPYLSAIGALIQSLVLVQPEGIGMGLNMYFVIFKIYEKIAVCPFEKEAPTILYEDNAACIAQLKEGYIKGDRTKHISPKFFFTHDLQKSGDINVQQIHSSENLADLFTKALPTTTFKKLLHQLGLRRFKDLQ
ncbi:uncharacterized protein LOC141589674 [Silene latifolia]|uniref:uncharacterized protein LOC141589674 n=1 Tax=Silene latifolia TaxID=37657 RepID=UPI003D773694